MKNLLAIASLGLFITGCVSMPQAASEPLIKYERVVEIPATNKEKIYDGSRQWFAKNFNDSNSVIKYEDPKTGSIIGKGSMQYACLGGVLACYGTEDDKLEFTVRVDAKDNKARVSFEDLNIHSPSTYSSGVRSLARDSKVILQNEVTAVKSMLDNTINNLAGDVKTGARNTDW